MPGSMPSASTPCLLHLHSACTACLAPGTNREETGRIFCHTSIRGSAPTRRRPAWPAAPPLVNLVTTWAFKEKKWWLFAAGIVLLNLVNFDYAMGGVLLMLIFYLCRQRRWLAGLAFFLLYLPIPYAQPADPWPLQLGGRYFSFTVFSLLALPLILARTNFRPKVPRWLFYLYYPAHLLLLWLLQTAL